MGTKSRVGQSVTRLIGMRLLMIALMTLTVLYGIPVKGQSSFVSHEADNWFFGSNAGIVFNGLAVIGTTVSAMNQHEGTAVASDPETGRLLFYTNGTSVWNSQHQLMQGGTNLLGHRTSSQTALIVRDPGNASSYYLFTVGAGTYVNPNNNGFRYSRIDITQGAGLGAVTQANIPIQDSTAEKLTATRHCNGRDYWILVHDYGVNGNRFYAYLLTPDGLQSPVVSAIGTVYPDGTALQGCFKFSPQGELLAVSSAGPQTLEIFRFDRLSGRVSGRTLVDQGDNFYGIEFSPSGNYLYTALLPSPGTPATLSQYNLAAGNLADIRSSRTVLHSESATWQGAQLQMGPDKRIYVSFYGKAYLGVIQKPDSPGTTSSYLHQGIDLLGKRTQYGLPNFVQANFFYKTSGTDADSLSDFPCTLPEDSNHCFAYAGEDVFACPGDTVFLIASGSGTLTWVAGSPTLCADCDTLQVIVERDSEYILRAKGAGDCKDFDTVHITALLEPTVDPGPEVWTCRGVSTHLRAHPGQEDSTMEYRWTPGTGLSCDTCFSPSATPDRATSYYITVSNRSGCSNTDSVRVNVFTASDVRVSPDTTICIGDSVMIGVSGAKSYQWETHPSLSCLSCSTPVATPEVTTTYFVTSTDSNGCVYRDSVTVNVTNSGTLQLSGDTVICDGEYAVLKATGSRFYHWRPTSDVDCDTCSTVRVSPDSTTTYYVVGEGTGGRCASVDSITVSVRPIPVLPAGSDTTACLGDEVLLGSPDLVKFPRLSFLWSPGAYLSDSTVSRPHTTVSEVRTFVLIARDLETGCEVMDSVTVSPVSLPNDPAGQDTMVCPGAEVTLGSRDSLSNSRFAFDWAPRGLVDNPENRSPTVAVVSTTTFILTLTDKESGCSTTDSITVQIADLPPDLSGKDTAVCIGSLVQLGDSEQATDTNLSFRWAPASLLDEPFLARPTAYIESPTTFTLTVTDTRTGCQSTSTTFIDTLSAPTADAGPDHEICVGSGVFIGGPGHSGTSSRVRYSWSPTTGLDDPSSPHPKASPSYSTVYTVTATDERNGCSNSDSVFIRVGDLSSIRTWIPDYTKRTIGEPFILEIFSEDVSLSAGIDELSLELFWDSNILTADTASIRSLLYSRMLAGWNVEVEESVRGYLRLFFRAQGGAVLKGSGALAGIQMRMFLGNSSGSTIDYRISVPSECQSFSTGPVWLEIDTICGLDLRLIEASAVRYQAPRVSPNPTQHETVAIKFGIGIGGPVIVQISDVNGRRVGTLVDSYLDPGYYQVEWDASDMASGIYWITASSGTWKRVVRVVVAR